MITEKKDKEFVLDQDLWPAWPFLPMQNEREHGFLIAGQGFKIHVMNMFRYLDERNVNADKELEACVKHEFKTVDELLSAGWIVD